MAKTHLDIRGTSFFIDGKATYSETAGTNPAAHGLLMNARFIQGVFDDASDPSRFARFGRDTWDADQNTAELIAALPQWYHTGLRAFTVGFQGGGPFFTMGNHTIECNPFGPDGKKLDRAFAQRMETLICAADETGMVVIVSLLYQGQVRHLSDGRAIRNAVATGSRFLRDIACSNVIIEVANEHTVGEFRKRPIVSSTEGAVYLMDLARSESGGLPTGCSFGGGECTHEVAEASDVIMVHGNGCSRQQYYNMIRKVQGWELDRPIVCNEDSEAFGQLAIAFATGTSWGYYNNMSKQEPPCDWGITSGMDRFFAARMAQGIGLASAGDECRYHLNGLEPELTYGNQRWIRLAALYPERVDYVDFYRNGKKYYTCYDEPYMVHWKFNYLTGPVEDDGSTWTAVVHQTDGNEAVVHAPECAEADTVQKGGHW